MVLTLYQPSLVPGGATANTVTFINITANKRNLKLR